MTSPLIEPDPRIEGTPRSVTRPGVPATLIVCPSTLADRRWMARALERARQAALADEVPVGAVVVQEDRMVAEGRNHTVEWNDPTAHAEVVALRAAAGRLGQPRLPGTTLYVTLEPCAQCAGALVLARVSRLVYGAPDPKAGMAGSLGNLLQDPRLNHRMQVTPGVLAVPAAELLTGFFRERRP